MVLALNRKQPEQEITLETRKFVIQETPYFVPLRLLAARLWRNQAENNCEYPMQDGRRGRLERELRSSHFDRFGFAGLHLKRDTQNAKTEGRNLSWRLEPVINHKEKEGRLHCALE